MDRSPLDPKFLDRVRVSIFANPFTTHRHLADCQLTGLDPAESPQRVLEAAIHTVDKQVRELTRVMPQPMSFLTGPERERHVYLLVFQLFHRYIGPMDAHIRAQADTLDNLTLACGPDLERDFKRYGFSSRETELYIGLFFQMRRAFFLISTTLTGVSPCMAKLRAHLWRSVFTHDIGRYATLLRSRLEDFSTLLLGETGTGKGVAAAAIGQSGFIPYRLRSHRFAIGFPRAFLELNLAQFPEQLLESEVFGHARGAFTGAVKDHEGVLARTSPHGALFLDEIAETSLSTQIKLLRVLQERRFTPLGSHDQKRFAGRLIGATNRNIEQMIGQGTFREDFYFRLCTDQLTLPPLRQRIEESDRELPVLVTVLSRRITGEDDERLNREILDTLASSLPPGYAWPGNVRELEQAIRRILVHGSLPPVTPVASRGLPTEIFDRGLTAAEMIRAYCRHLYHQHQTLQGVARITGLDRRTVKKYLENG